MPSTPRSSLPATEPADFAALGTPPRLVAALRESGRTTPFPIQTATLPDALAGRDVLGRAQTGSGKTIAFAVPAVARLAASTSRRRPGRPRALVLVPTRELADQVQETVRPLAAAADLRTLTIYGGVGQNPQVTALRRGVDLVVATPGRLEDLIGQGHLDLDAVEVTVIDEADHMADLGFLPAVRRLLDRTPAGTQRLLFSATLDGEVDVLVRRYLRNPARHSMDESAASVPTMTHRLVTVHADHKDAVTRDLLTSGSRTLAFTRTKHGAKKLAKRLSAAGIPSADLHGNLSQAARTRNLTAFHTGEVRVLVATDIAARGIHVDDVGLVVHVDPPAEHKAYLHRSGRTARAGSEGTVVTVATLEQRTDVRRLLAKANVTAVEQHLAPSGATASAAVSSAPRPASDRSAADRSASGRRGP
ncbi:MAG TPA: DEAD/DEAH box helicase, partial [Dermatophilaceae bacterium]|nr:DEAD/DEAH box helicase [Dermatophilaceae bacterium]